MGQITLVPGSNASSEIAGKWLHMKSFLEQGLSWHFKYERHSSFNLQSQRCAASCRSVNWWVARMATLTRGKLNAPIGLVVLSCFTVTINPAFASKSVDRTPFPVIGPCYQKFIPNPDPKVFEAVTMCFSRSRVILATAYGEGHQLMATWHIRNNTISFRSSDPEMEPGGFACKITYPKQGTGVLLDCGGISSSFSGKYHIDKSQVFETIPGQELEK